MAIPSWITLSQYEGVEGQTDVTFTASANNTSRARTAVLRVRNPHTGLKRNVTITQDTYYYNIPLTLEVVGPSGLFYMFRYDGNRQIQPIQYSKNGGEWQTLPIVTAQTLSEYETKGVPIDEGDIIRLKGVNSSYGIGETKYKLLTRRSPAIPNPKPEFDVYGNIMSLVYGDNFVGNNTLTDSYTFEYLFAHSAVRYSHNLVLPATALTEGCYKYMFNYMQSNPEGTLTWIPVRTPPELPATTLADSCYYGMFAGCENLDYVPELPATTLANSCYNQMFEGCRLIDIAVLPARTLVSQCYDDMFAHCESLNSITCLATDISAYYCTNGWVTGVSSTGLFLKNPEMEYWSSGASGIPLGWAVQNVPYSTMPLTFDITSDGNIIWKTNNSGFTTTIEYSKNYGEWTSITSSTGGTSISVVSGDTVQFRGNNDTYSNTNYIYNYFGDSTAQFNAYGNIMSLIDSTDFSGLTTLDYDRTFQYFFNNCTGLTDASNLILPATTLSNRCYNRMFYGCSNLITPPALPATTLASTCYQSMFRNCTSLTTPPSLPATALTEYCYAHMFRSCSGLTAAPALYAPTLVDQCYFQMFDGCTNLSYVRCLATNPNGAKTSYWLGGVSSTGTFEKAAGVTWPTGEDGIPTNWTVEEIT